MNNENEKMLVEKLKNMYPDIEDEEINFSFCPYRICPVGAHIDHQKGNVTGFAINYGITIAYVPNDNHYVEATSLNFDGTKKEDILNIPNKQEDWADYVRGATRILHDKYGIDKGFRCLIYGSLPIGGVSSSAAVIIAFFKALCDTNGLKLLKDDVVKLVQEVENKYIGVSSGVLDQSCELFCKKDSLLYLDINSGVHELIPQSSSVKPYKIAIVFSGAKRTLVGSSYNTRVDELKSASYFLKAYSGMEYGNYKDSVLRSVPKVVFEKYGDRLPSNFSKRAYHYYSEMDRVEEGIKAWSIGDIEKFGMISFDSGDSSINNYEAGSPELKAIHEIMKDTNGVYGGRFSGAGFNGCCFALVNPDMEESIKEEITKRYLSEFPQYKESFKIYFCETADGCDF